MKTLFDFDAIRGLFASGFRMRFDAMHAVTGPYAHAILEGELGSGAGTVVNGVPLPDFGGLHPDPNLTYAKDLYDLMDVAAGCYRFRPPPTVTAIAISLSGARFSSPRLIRWRCWRPMRAMRRCTKGLAGIARSMPTSAAADRRVRRPSSGSNPMRRRRDGSFSAICLTPALRRSFAARKDSCTGSKHVREKDGLWAVLLWLNILAKRHISVADLAREHWGTYGRNYYTRHDFDEVDLSAANGLMDALRGQLASLPGSQHGALKVSAADDFEYHDPVDGSDSLAQGVRVLFEDGSRIVYRLSGTGTVGATLRVYIERYVPENGDLGEETQSALADLIALSRSLAGIEQRTGRKAERHHLSGMISG